MQKAAAILGGFLIAVTLTAGARAEGGPAATQRALTIGPAADDGTIQLHVFMGEGGGEAVVMVRANDAGVAKLAESLRERVRDAANGKQGEVRCDIQISNNVPYRGLAAVLIAAAQANVKQFRLSTDGKNFVDETMPAIDAQGTPGVPEIIKMARQEGATWVAAFGAQAKKLGNDGDAQSAAIAEAISGRSKKLKGSLQVLLQPDADVPCGDVVAICKDCARAGIKNVAFAPAGGVVTTGADHAGGPATHPSELDRVRNIVYIVDASSSVADSFPELQAEIVHAINRMIPVEKFDVVLISDKTTAIFGDLKRAAPAAKIEAGKQMAAFKAGGTIDGKLGPFKSAFEKAFALKPDMIYFLSESRFDPQLLKVVSGLNKDAKVHVNAIVFERKDKKLEALMTDLARSNGGVYKFVSQ